MFFSCVLREGNLASPKQKIKDTHCVKRVHIRSFSGPYFTEYGEIQSECGKIQTRKTPNTGTFHAVATGKILAKNNQNQTEVD